METPEGNLVDGMRWLQGTFGNRFNRFTAERRVLEQAVEQERKLAEWKVAIAPRLRQETIASNTCIAQRLHLGDPSNISRLVKTKTSKLKT